MSNPQVSIIILTYSNGWGNVEKCLKSLSNLKYKPFEIILVDNASTDDTLVRVLSSKYNELNIKLIRNKVNVGFCRGNNDAVKVAQGKYILFLNNDTEVTPYFLDPLVNSMIENKTIGVVQPKIVQLKNKEKLDACASFLTNTGFLYHYGYSQNQADNKFNKRIKMYSVKGACFLTRKNLIDKIGLFDDDYFAYFEETDFCHRVWLAGYSVEYIPESVIFHLGGPDNIVSSFIQYHSFKNRINTYLKNLDIKNLVKILAVHIPACFALSLIFILRGNVGYAAAIMRAIVWNVANLPRTISKRQQVQNKIRVLKDVDILPQIYRNVKVSYYKHFLGNARSTYEFEEI